MVSFRTWIDLCCEFADSCFFVNYFCYVIFRRSLHVNMVCVLLFCLGIYISSVKLIS